MTQTEMQQIIELVTKSVLSEVEYKSLSVCNDGRERVLLIGDKASEIMEKVFPDAVAVPLGEELKETDICAFRHVLIDHLTLTQLADIAQGRPTDPVSHAVIYALLNGIDILMTGRAIPYRKYVSKGSTAFYGLLESYVRTLQIFGIKLLEKKSKCSASPEKFPSPVELPIKIGNTSPKPSRLITEAEALAMVRSGEKISLPEGVILTPSAKDVLAKANFSAR